MRPIASAVDYPYSPRGDGNNSQAVRIVLFLAQLITLIPREGTETRLARFSFGET